MNKQLLGFVYFMTMVWMFFGIALIADLFMEAIEVITSTTKRVKVTDKDG